MFGVHLRYTSLPLILSLVSARFVSEILRYGLVLDNEFSACYFYGRTIVINSLCELFVFILSIPCGVGMPSEMRLRR